MHNSSQESTTTAAAAPASTAVESQNGPPPKLPPLSSEIGKSPAAVPTSGTIVESPESVHSPHNTALSNEYGAHLSGHEARAFPGIFTTTRTNRSGSVRKDDTAPGSREDGKDGSN